ncbi:MAG: hypothetical protein HYT08_04190 [Candidatus Levybacteria bacterium]|nr:hypothetical protein [Candidatus Levybacteria bacterium]
MDNNLSSKPSGAQPTKNKPVIYVVVRTKEGITFKDRVRAVTSYNEKGPFDVLPEHENFISLINQHFVIHTMDGKENEVKVDTAVIKVYKNEVHIFLGLSEQQ